MIRMNFSTAVMCAFFSLVILVCTLETFTLGSFGSALYFFLLSVTILSNHIDVYTVVRAKQFVLHHSTVFVVLYLSYLRVRNGFLLSTSSRTRRRPTGLKTSEWLNVFSIWLWRLSTSCMAECPGVPNFCTIMLTGFCCSKKYHFSFTRIYW